jgi:hypothetical protein
MASKLFDDEQAHATAMPEEDAVARLPGALVSKLDTQLRRLADLHLRVSLARLDREVAAGAGLQQVVDGLYDPSSIVGVGGDGSIVAAFLGPRQSEDAQGDRAAAARIERLFAEALAAAGIERSRLRQNLTIVHGWTDEIHDVPGLALALERQRKALGRKDAGSRAPSA